MILLPDPEDNPTDADVKAMLMALPNHYQQLATAIQKCSKLVFKATTEAQAMGHRFYVLKNRAHPPHLDGVECPICKAMRDLKFTF